MESIATASVDNDEYAMTRRGLSSRHLKMMAIGAAIGTGLFIGTGQSLTAFLLAGCAGMAMVVFFIMTPISELATYLPVPVSYNQPYI